MENTFNIDQKSLTTILSSMQPICAKRTTLDATTSILFQADHKELVIKSTDLEISLQYSCSLNKSEFEDSRAFLVSGKRVFDLVKELEGDIKFCLDGNRVCLVAGSAELSLNIKDAQEFPPFPERIENLMELDSKLLLSMLEKVAFLIPQNNSNSALNGLFIEVDNQELKMTATNGHCLAQAKTSQYTLEKPASWLIPKRAVFELKKIIEVSGQESVFIGTCGNQLVFSNDSFNFFTKLLSDKFPQYRPILEKTGFNKGAVKRLDLLKSLRRSSCMLSGQFIPTQFSFSSDYITISIQNKEVGTLQETIKLESFDCDNLEIRFYAPYLINGLQVLTQENIAFYISSSGRPIIFENVEDAIEVVYLVMPVSPTNNAQ